MFVVALSSCSLDAWLYPDWPLGTHFLSHLLVALALYLSPRTYLLNRCPART